jgi:uncharacterized membrane protein YoaK (UPF0700 family)
MVNASRAGVSTIIAELMLLGIVVALGTIVYAFASNAFGNFGAGFAGAVSNAGDTLSERLIVEQVAFSPCPNAQSQQACVYVRDVGQLDAVVVAIYVNDLTAGTFVGSVNVNVPVRVGSFASVGIQIQNFSVQHGHAYSFTIVTSRGNSVTYNAVA